MTVSTLDILDVAVIHDNTTSGEVVNNFQFQKVSVGTITDQQCLDDIERLVQTIYNLIKAVISIRNVLREVYVVNRTTGQIVGSTAGGTYTAGTAADPALPQGTAQFVYFKTTYPRVILKKYFPSGATANVAPGGGPSSAPLAALGSVATTLLSDMTAITGTYRYGYDSPKALTFVRPDIAVVPIYYAYQRRRKARVGS